MNDLRLVGCRSRSLIGYLKGLGLFRVTARQATVGARGRWVDGVLELRTPLAREELAELLLERYTPAPVVSPWNGGSGFHPKDNTAAFRAIESSADPRLGAFREAIEVSRRALVSLDLYDKPTSKDVKARLLSRLRAELPDAALEWLDAAVVLLDDDPAYPPLLGSGGNDGRFDFANNYAQAVVSALAVEDGPDARARTRALLAAALDDVPAALDKGMSLGHFLRDASPVNSPLGQADALGNPWDLVLAVEGSLVLTAGAARRHGASVDAQAVAPFTVRSTAAGYGSALAGERGRAELWLPLWSRWAGLSEVESMVREARAQVGRRRARSGLDFARAAGELAVARGIDAFERFAVLERAGQSNLAVPAGHIEVAPRPSAAAIQTVDDWLEHALRRAGSLPPGPAVALRRLERLLFAFADDSTSTRGCAVLEQLGATEQALSVAGRRAAEARLVPVRAAQATPWLEAADDGSVEFAVAVSLASLRDRHATRELPALRDYLHGTGLDPNTNRRSYETDVRLAGPRRAGPMVRLAHLHARRFLDAQRAHSDRLVDGGSGAGEPDPKRSLAFRYGRPCPLAAARRFASQDQLDHARVLRLTEGLSLLDWREVNVRLRHEHDAAPDPAFELLALAWAGTAERPLVPRPDWPARLAAGAVEGVLGDAVLRLRLGGLVPLVRSRDLMATPPDGPRLVAALLVPLSVVDRTRIARRMTVSSDEPEATEVPQTSDKESEP